MNDSMVSFSPRATVEVKVSESYFKPMVSFTSKTPSYLLLHQ